MKKLHRKSSVHPTPPLFPATILAVASALPPEDQELLAYLISCAAAACDGCGGAGDHPPSFSCYCFNCYTSYWVRWDCSPNRQIIHQIVDAYEEEIEIKKKIKNSGKWSKGAYEEGIEIKKIKQKSKNRGEQSKDAYEEGAEIKKIKNKNRGEQRRSFECEINKKSDFVVFHEEEDDERSTTEESAAVCGGDGGGALAEEKQGRGAFRRFVSFVGDKIWSIWN